MITIKVSNGHGTIEKYLENAKRVLELNTLDKFGKVGVEQLRIATPKDTGKTSELWTYSIEKKGSNASLEFKNSNVNNGVPIAIILQYGHGTGTGGWVDGTDYINPVLQKVFENILEEIEKELRAI